MEDMLVRKYKEEAQKAAEKHAQLSDIQLCDMIAEMSNQEKLKETIEGKEALLMRLTAMSPKELNKLRKYAEKKFFEGNFGYNAVLDVFDIRILCDI